MADLVEVSFSVGSDVIGTAFHGVYETMPGRTALGLSKIRWVADNPAAYLDARCRIAGSFADAARGEFRNDMTLIRLSESAGTAEFEART